MKHRSLGLWLPVFFAATAPAAAHHSFAAEYDRDKPIMLTGTVTRLEWTNPHARLYIEVKDESGALVTWDFELGSPAVLIRWGGPGRHCSLATWSRSPPSGSPATR